MNEIKVDTSDCLKSCSGSIISTLVKSERKLQSIDYSFSKSNWEDYAKYKKHSSPCPMGKGRYTGHSYTAAKCVVDKDYCASTSGGGCGHNCCQNGEMWKNTLRFVRISFGTQTFDRITKDRAAKFVDMLSAIGGTMGLLTGSSIISAVEILYFVGKMIYRLVKKKMK